MNHARWAIFLVLGIPFYLTYGQGHYAKNSDEAMKAAQDFESAVFSSVPKSKQFISYFDIDIADGHMMLIAQDNLLSASQKVQHEIYSTLLDMWRRTKYVRIKKYAGWIEVLSVQGVTIQNVKTRPRPS